MAGLSPDDELERYKRLLDDWQKGRAKGQEQEAEETPGPKRVEEPVSKGSERAKLRRTDGKESSEDLYPKGTILALDDEDLVVYRRAVTAESYDMVYSLLGDGAVKIDGVEFEKHEVTELGQLSTEDFKKLQHEMRWSRELIAENCPDPEAAARIPDPTGAEPVSRAPAEAGAGSFSSQSGGVKTQAPPVKPSWVEDLTQQESAARVVESKPQGKTRIRRGQIITLNISGRTWDAVYWGRDKKGTVVAHSTHGQWALMHLDLNQYKDTMTIGSNPDSLLIDQISQGLKAGKKG
ncbi:hypothetical protein IIC65_01240 [Candidatus Sumerlaeota bacterium]|nr:hypothetical protein [Candidatus Sumerlaeota bacterium]